MCIRDSYWYVLRDKHPTVDIIVANEVDGLHGTELDNIMSPVSN